MIDDERISLLACCKPASTLPQPDKAVPLLMTAGMTILQRRFVAEKAIEHMTAALDVTGSDMRQPIYGAGD